MKSTLNVNMWLQYDGSRSKLLLTIDSSNPWYECLDSAISENIKSVSEVKSKENLVNIKDIVSKEFTREVEIYQKLRNGRKDSDEKWIREVIQCGTLSDKIAALALVVQDSPLHNLESLDSLLNYCKQREQRACQLAMDAIKDLLIHNILPDRKLKTFGSHDWSSPSMNMSQALLCWYEDQLVSRVNQFVDHIDKIGFVSNVEYFKKHCMDIACDLLINKPEQEARLLSMIVNKLGDPSRVIFVKATELLNKTIEIHPVMKLVLVREVRQFISRPKLQPRALHSAITFLTQLPLHKNDSDVSLQLVECYIGLFELAIKRTDYGSRLLSNLLLGVNRAFPFLGNPQALTRHFDSLFKIAHNEHFSTAVQALMLLSHILLDETTSSSAKSKNTGRIGDSETLSLSKQLTTAKSKNMLTVEDGDFSLSSRPVDRFYRALYSLLLSEQVITRSRNTVFFRLLFRSLRCDPSNLRSMSFIKRMLMVSSHCSASSTTGILLLISEICAYRPSLISLFIHDSDVDGTMKSARSLNGSCGSNGSQFRATGNDFSTFDSYDAAKREPLYAASSQPLPWEVSLLVNHFHPSVKSFIQQITSPDSNHVVHFDGDPLLEFSVPAFLNRFAYKNPKSKEVSSKGRRPTASQEFPVNLLSAESLDSVEQDIAPDKFFFYKFFGQRNKMRLEGRSKVRSKKKSQFDEHEEGDGEDRFDASDDNEEIDVYADTIAKNMIKAHSRSIDPDLDDDDESEFGIAHESDDDFGDDGENLRGGKSLGDDNENCGSDSESDDYELATYKEDEDVDYMHSRVKNSKSSNILQQKTKIEDATTRQLKKNKLKSKTKAGSTNNDMGDFADATDFEADVDAIMKQFAPQFAESKIGPTSKRRTVSLLSKDSQNKRSRIS